MQATQNINVKNTIPLITPKELKARIPMTQKANATVVEGREAIKAILAGEDERMLVVVGPCSIHDEKAALEYAAKFKALADKVSDRLLPVMRVYFEKPRTTVGWKGLINDPHLDGSFDIAEGLSRARQLLLEISEMGVATATEMLDPITPVYCADLVVWGSIGARTTESQTHRQMASGLSMPIGYKNGTDGGLEIAINAMEAARNPHAFLGIDADGRTCIVNTLGNPWGHVILRGGRSGSNYDADSVRDAAARLAKEGLPARLMIDCSHANSNKDFRNQAKAWKEALAQRAGGDKTIVGLMLESNLNEGAQKLGEDLSALKYGVSITDACVGWAETEELVHLAHEAVSGAAAAATA